jgi:hypothetical protein
VVGDSFESGSFRSREISTVNGSKVADTVKVDGSSARGMQSLSM